jgi:hypothetical protein
MECDLSAFDCSHIPRRCLDRALANAFGRLCALLPPLGADMGAGAVAGVAFLVSTIGILMLI